jgi:hypothetical protein
LIANISKCIFFSRLIEKFPNFSSSVIDIKDGLLKVVEDVHGWLDKKRMTFPRFFFVADDDLLTLVSNSRDPIIIKE